MLPLALLLGLATPILARGDEPVPLSQRLADIHQRSTEIEIELHSAEEYADAAEKLRALLTDLAELDALASSDSASADDEPSFDERLDLRLLRSQLEIRRFEIEDAALWQLVPVRYLQLFTTDSLLLRPCAAGSEAVDAAIRELEALPQILQNARANLTRPAATWTENAIATARYAELLLESELPAACIEAPNRPALLEAAAAALPAVRAYAEWMRSDLLPRSDRPPAWAPELIETYRRVQEWLPDPPLEGFLRIAEEDERATRDAMRQLAKRIHPSGDLRRVWELMKDETPPWSEVRPMAERYVEMTAEWLRDPGDGGGAHLLEIPERFDYGTVIATPMARRILSFGGASYGPTVAGRISGYYVLTPIEPWISPEEQSQRLRSYNPYWTHVISYHEWVGHNVQRAWATAGAERHRPSPIRRSYRSAYLSQAWSFYIEKLFEDHGYYETLPHMEALKTRMARLQMRMWRIQRILTKLRMAQGEMTFDQAMQAYIDEIGMEPANALLEVQRDSQSPASPGREILGERLILEMWDEYRQRLGEHARLRDFHQALLEHGELPLPAIRQILFRSE
mgnify:CR=1 FL=1